MAQRGKPIGPQEAHDHMESGAILVCGYDSDEKFEKNHLEGAMPFSEFQEMEEALDKDREVIFYCA